MQTRDTEKRLAQHTGGPSPSSRTGSSDSGRTDGLLKTNGGRGSGPRALEIETGRVHEHQIERGEEIASAREQSSSMTSFRQRGENDGRRPVDPRPIPRRAKPSLDTAEWRSISSGRLHSARSTTPPTRRRRHRGSAQTNELQRGCAAGTGGALIGDVQASPSQATRSFIVRPTA